MTPRATLAGVLDPNSRLTLERVPLTRIYLGSTHSPNSLDTVRTFLTALEQGDDLLPLHLVVGPEVPPGFFRLEDGRKRFAAYLLAGVAHALSLVERRPPLEDAGEKR